MQAEPEKAQDDRDDGGIARANAQARTQDGCASWADDPRNAYNWPERRKWINVAIHTLNGAACTMAASVIVPLNRQVAATYGETNEEVVLLATASFYLLGQGAGPFIFSPISEQSGRRAAFISSAVGYVLFNVASALAPNIGSLIVLRFIAGIFGSSGPSIGAAGVSDHWPPAQRGAPIAVYSLGPIMVGSILGSYLALAPTWRWGLWSMAILGGILLAAQVVGLRESYAPVLQRRIAQAEGIPDERSLRLSTRTVVARTFSRPLRMLKNPFLLAFCLYYAYLYALIYPSRRPDHLTHADIFIVAIPLLFAASDAVPELSNYGWPVATAGLSYLALGGGFIAAAVVAIVAQNRIYRQMALKVGEDRPEFRLVLTAIGGCILPIGLLITGATAQAATSAAGPLVGIALAAFGNYLAFASVQNYVVDASVPFSAAAMADASLLRSVLGGLLPLAAPRLYRALEWLDGGLLLACLSLPILPLPFVMLSRGPAVRARFPFAP